MTTAQPLPYALVHASAALQKFNGCHKQSSKLVAVVSRAMGTSGGSSSSTSNERVLYAAAAAGIAVCLSMAALWQVTPWMHGLLSYSKRHPEPQGQQLDYGVVLGYALHRNGSCTQPLRSRVEVAVQLYQQGAVSRLIFSGAHPGGGLRNVSEAHAMVEVALSLVEQPPPAGRWLLEEKSTSTRTNALFSLDMIRQQQQQQQQQQPGQQHKAQRPPSVVLITNPFHQLRSYFTFRKAAQQAGMDVQLYVAAAPFAGHCGYGHWLLDAAMDQVDFWRDVGALGYYRLRGWL